MKLQLSSYTSRITDYLTKQEMLENRRVILLPFEQNPSTKLLDCGCHNGEQTLEVAERIGTQKIYGIDIIQEYLDKAKAKGIEVYKSDLNQKLPFESESFDAILAAHVIEHLSNTDIFIKEISRVLKVGAYVVIQAVNLAAFHNMLYLLLGKQPIEAHVSDEVLVGTWHPKGKYVKPMSPAHKRVFTPGALKELLEYYGFNIEKSINTGYFPLPFPLSKAMCFLDKRHATIVTIKARKSK